MKTKKADQTFDERFDDEFAVEHTAWGDDFAWADNADAKASQIKDFFKQEIARVLTEIWPVTEIGIAALDEHTNTWVAGVNDTRFQIRKTLREKIAQFRKEYHIT